MQQQKLNKIVAFVFLRLNLKRNMSGQGDHKSFETAEPRVRYCTEHSVRFHPAQRKLQEETIEKLGRKAAMLGAPEVLQLGANLIQLIGGKRVLDIGTFTGASALAWALATPPDGEIITMDVQDGAFKAVGAETIREAGVSNKITLKLQSATKTLDELIAAGESGKFDFVFIDAHKEDYPEYYEKSLQLLRKGGIIAIDNALWKDSVINPEMSSDPSSKILDDLNKTIHTDTRVNCNLLPIGDGLMLAFKK